MIALLVIALWYFLGWWLPQYLYKDAAHSGLFGDMFGCVNSLFSGLAFVGVILALVLQTKELQYQRTELQESQEVWKASAEAQQESQVAEKRQADSLFLAAYLNSVIALAETHASVLELEQEQELARLRLIVDGLKDRAAKTIGIDCEPPSLISLLTQRLNRYADDFLETWEMAHRLGMGGFGQMKQAANDLDRRLLDLYRYVDESLNSDVKRIQEDVLWLKGEEFRSRDEKGKDKAVFEGYYSKGLAVQRLLKNLASQCELLMPEREAEKS